MCAREICFYEATWKLPQEEKSLRSLTSHPSSSAVLLGLNLVCTRGKSRDS
jgi:hypothetical protein